MMGKDGEGRVGGQPSMTAHRPLLHSEMHNLRMLPEWTFGWHMEAERRFAKEREERDRGGRNKEKREFNYL